MRSFSLAPALLCMTVPATLPAQQMRPSAVDQLPASKPILVSSYGPAPLQIGELRVPPGKGPFPIAVIIHGGCWTKGFATMRNTAAVASALAEKGLATWNIEYRQVGDAGAGWPGTFLDWGAATDHLRVLAKQHPLDLANITVIGHSAGAHAALFVASRSKLPIESEIRGSDPLPIKGVVAIDGPGDLRSFVGLDAQVCGKPVIERFMGGKPETMAARYEQASPAALLPLGVRQALISSSRVLSPEAAEAYRSAAVNRKDKVDLRVFADSGHFEVIAPGTPEWREVETLILNFVASNKR